MSTSSKSWKKRKARLDELLGSEADEDAEGLALDRILHGQSVIGKTSKTVEIDSLRFTDKDLTIVGTLEYGQFAVIDVVTCNLDGRVYVRKTIEKRFAFKTRDQCNPQLERDILLSALRADTVWTPHLLCAFQTPTHLNLVMDYAEGGTLWDVLESSPHDGRVLEEDLRWWFPQVISALAWCHAQGFVHRDVKPHNFVLTQTSHVQLIDFGSAAPLLPPRGPDGARLVPRRHCLVPCGTCDYISPEILQAHEAAIVALEMSDEDGDGKPEPSIEDPNAGGYGVETDWWSMGAMLYEMAYGVAPFFAKDIRTTYLKIMDHRKSLKFKKDFPISHALQDLLRRLLTDFPTRLGYGGVKEIQDHPFFDGIRWDELQRQPRPEDLHLPLFTYADNGPPQPLDPGSQDTSHTSSHSASVSNGFAFSAFFQPSEPNHTTNSSPGLSILHPTPRPSRSILRDQASSFFIGFSWGPSVSSFPSSPPAPEPTHTPSPPSTLAVPTNPLTNPHATPRASNLRTLFPAPLGPSPSGALTLPVPTRTPFRAPLPFATPLRTPGATLPRASTLRRTPAPRRAVSDREAMRQLVDCIGLSARKKVLAAGRTPRSASVERGVRVDTVTRAGAARPGTGTTKSLRFVPAPINIEPGMYSFAGRLALERSEASMSASASASASASLSLSGGLVMGLGSGAPSETDESESDAPPSPSPSPRPGSAMSMLSRRSATPTTASALTGTGTWTGSLRLPLSAGLGTGMRRSSSPAAVVALQRAFEPSVESANVSVVREERRRLEKGKGRERSASFTLGAQERALREHMDVDEGVDEVDDDLEVELEAETEMDTGAEVRRDGLGALGQRYTQLMADLADIEARLAIARGNSSANSRRIRVA
ncbi:kinase-like protein [Dentipellis sp. KUC8613]|nr:kinase-like protein [Dentipellis sp. KUC8613]